MTTELKSANSAKVGKIFKDARNDIGLSKNEVAHALVMNIKYIQAIESGNYSSFPSEGFARAYFIKYQDFLSINCDFPSIYNEDNRKVEIIEKSITKINRSLIPFFKKALIIIFIIFVSFSSYNAIFNNDSSTNSKNNSVSNSQNDQFIAQEISNNIAEKDQPLVFEEDFYEENKANIENEASNLMVDNKLRLNFFDQCWIEIYSRNELIANQLFQQGDVYILDIKKPFKVVVGDADNVEGTYNGDSIDFITNANRLRVNTITFNDE
jgi:cytoskeletal protein RodZ